MRSCVCHCTLYSFREMSRASRLWNHRRQGTRRIRPRARHLFAFTRHIRALFVGTLAFALLASSLLVLAQVRGIWIVALAFAFLYGWSNGVMTSVRGTVPAELFGPRGYGALLGRLAQPQFIAKAIAPLALTLVFAVDASRNVSLWTLVACGGLALYAYQRAVSAARAVASKPLR